MVVCALHPPRPLPPPPPPLRSPPAVCVRLWLQPQHYWRGRVNRPVRSPRISVGLECAVALALAGDTTLGGGGGALVVVAGWAGARLGRGGKIMLMSCPRHPLWLGGHGHWGTERASGCASPEVTVPDQNHTELLLIKWLSVHPVVSQHYTTTNPLPLHKKTPVKRYRLAIETATLPLYLPLLLPATVNKYGTWYWRCSIPSPFPSPLLVERSPLHTKQSITDSLISNYAL